MISNTLKFCGNYNFGHDPFAFTACERYGVGKTGGYVSHAYVEPYLCFVFSLTKAPYERLRHSYLKFLTYKTVFLLALATSRWSSVLHAISYVPSCLRFKNLMVRFR